MIEIDDLNGSRKVLVSEIPDPFSAVGNDHFDECSVPTAVPGFQAVRAGPAERQHVGAVGQRLHLALQFVGGVVGGFLPGVFGALIGQSLDHPAPYRYPLLVAGAAMLPALLAIRAIRADHSTLDEATTAAHAAHDARFQLLAPSVIMTAIAMMGVVRMFQVSGLAATTSFFNVYLDRSLAVPTAQIGTIAAFGRLLAAPAALATPFLTRRFGNFRTVIISTFMTAVAIIPMALVHHWAAAGLTLVGVVALSSIRYSSSLVYFLELVPPDRRATVSGVTEMAAGVSFTLITFAGGYIITLFGYQQLFILGACMSLIGAWWFWWYFRRFPRVSRA